MPLSSPCTSLPLLAWSPSGAPSLPSCTDPGSQGLRWAPTYPWGFAGQGCLRRIGSWISGDRLSDEVDVLSGPTVGTGQRAAPTCPHSLFVPGPARHPGTPERTLLTQCPSWGGGAAAVCCPLVLHWGIARRGPYLCCPPSLPHPQSARDGSCPPQDKEPHFLHLQDLSVQHKVSAEICWVFAVR